MKYTLHIIFLFFSYALIAQITIENNNYIYVNDRVVFSENYLNLKQSNSQFFLRNEAQLIQGLVNTANLGSGELSTYQVGKDA